MALRFAGESLPTMVSMDPERVVYASSFSKTVCPGIRVGYLVGPAGADRPDRQARHEHLHLARTWSRRAIVNQFCRSGALDRSIETVREALRERAQTLCEALDGAASRRALRRRPRAATSCGSTSRGAPT